MRRQALAQRIILGARRRDPISGVTDVQFR